MTGERRLDRTLYGRIFRIIRIYGYVLHNCAGALSGIEAYLDFSRAAGRERLP